MSTLAPGITVNGIKITSEEINGEVQYHPAQTFQDAKFEAMKALVIREILIQRAVELGMVSHSNALEDPDKVIDSLLDKEISVPNADDVVCQRYYDNNKKRFLTSPLFEVSHILYLAPIGDDEMRLSAKESAFKAIEKLKKNPKLFESIAREESACSSAKEGGRLGQISKGQTMPAFEEALFCMRANDLSLSPVETEVGFHIIKVHERAEGEQLPFDAVSDWIKDFLIQESWNRAFHQYVQILIGRAEISGFRFEGVKTPLVQ